MSVRPAVFAAVLIPALVTPATAQIRASERGTVSQTVDGTAETTLVLCHGGAVRLGAAGEQVDLAAGDTAILEGSAAVTIEPAASAVVFVVTIDKPAA